METADKPRPEDFGITEEDLGAAPCAWLAGHRLSVLAAFYLLVGAVVFGVMVRSGASVAAAGFFSVVLIAAASVLLLPAAVLGLCASEKAEERWLCARFPKLRACLAYRRAAAEHGQRERRAEQRRGSPQAGWSTMPVEALVEAVRVRLEAAVAAEPRAMDRDRSGIDFVVEGDGETVVVRCQPGSRPVAASLGREMVAAMADLSADRALIVCPGPSTPGLAEYIRARPIAVVPPWQLDDALPVNRLVPERADAP